MNGKGWHIGMDQGTSFTAVLASTIIALGVWAGASATQPQSVPTGVEPRSGTPYKPEFAALAHLVTAWIAYNFELPVPGTPATVEFVPSADMASLRTALAVPEHPPRWIAATQYESIVAFYDAQTATIYLPNDWSGAVPADVSVLVHEMVHHIEASAGAHNDRPQIGEKLAYEAQEKWLRLFGEGLGSTFGIDQFSLLVRTEWLY